MTNPEHDTQLLSRLVDIIETEIAPLTRKSVLQGNKIFGAALLYKHDFSTLLAATNNELESPLWHGEMHALKAYHEIPQQQRPAPQDLYFLSTHEPCSLCLSAITWSGFDNFYYFFSHKDSRDAFAIPHDLRILKEVFTLDPGGYRSENAYWKSYAIRSLIAETTGDEKAALLQKASRIDALYADLSDCYQQGKSANTIPLN